MTSTGSMRAALRVHGALSRGTFAVVVLEPRVGQAVQLGTKDVGGALEDRKCFGKDKLGHHSILRVILSEAKDLLWDR